MNWKLSEIAEWTQAKLYGDANLIIQKCVSSTNLCKEGITYAENKKDLDKIKISSIGAVFVKEDVHLENCSYLQVSSPRDAFNELLKRSVKSLFIEEGIHPTVIVYPGASIDPTAKIGPYVVIGMNAQIGPNCSIYPFCHIGDQCVVEENVTLHPHVTLYSQVHLKKNVIVHSGTVIGADGFGYNWNGKEHVKVPHIGGVSIGSNVEIGANSCIDRSVCGNTTVGDGTKIDNLVQVAHNVSIGALNIMAGQSGIAGSSSTEAGVIMGAQVGVADHIHLKSGVRVGGQSGVINNLEKGDYFGTPCLPLQKSLRVKALENRLPELFDRIKQMEKILSENGIKISNSQ